MWNRRTLLGAAGLAGMALAAGEGAAQQGQGATAPPGPAGTATGPAGGVTAGTGVTIRRGYVDGPWGQVHFRRAEPAGGAKPTRPPLVMFHQNPRSSYEYVPLMRLMAQDRLCLALDTPGYGESDPPPAPPGIAGYANALGIALENLGFGPGRAGPLDAFGFHTGTFLASELAIQRPQLVRRLALGGVPFTVGEERARFYDSLVTHRKKAPPSGSHLVDMWYGTMSNRPPRMSVERARGMLVQEQIPGDDSWWAYQGVFSYDCEGQLPKVQQPVRLLAVHDSLLAQTRAAKPWYRNSTLVEMPDVTGIFVLDGEAEAFAKALREFFT